jgi:hypothetical protein
VQKPECCQPKPPCCPPACAQTREAQLENQLAERADQIQSLSKQISQLQGVIERVVEEQQEQQAQVAAEDAELTSISYEAKASEPQRWTTPEEVHRKRQQRELDGLKSEIGDLKGNFSELVSLQRQQLEQMKQMGEAAAQARRQQVAEPVRTPEVEVEETVFPGRPVAPNPFEGPTRGKTPTRSLSPAPRTEGRVSLKEVSDDQTAVADAREAESYETASAEGVAVVNQRQQTPVVSVANGQTVSQRKPGLFSKFKKLGRRNVQETESVR